MSKSRLGRSKPTTDRVLESVADETRREIVAVLRERPSPVPVEELAANMVAAHEEIPVADIEEADRAAAEVSLTHVHLPTLAVAGLVEWTPGDCSVNITDHPAHDDDQLRDLLSADAEATGYDSVVRRLADDRRRHILAVLEEGDGTIGRRALARRVAASEVDEGSPDIDESTVDDVETSLYHRHLPALRRAGLVVSDGETVTYDGHPALDPSWLSIDLDGTGGTDSSARNVDGTRAADDSGTSVEPPQTTADEADD